LQTSNPSLVGKSFVLLVSKVKILKISSNQKQESSMVHVAMFLPDQDEMRNLCKGPILVSDWSISKNLLP
jgi:hypothetical protein